MIRIMNVKFNGLQKVMSRLALLLIAVVMFGCKDDLADPPVIKVYVNGAEYDATERFTVATGDRISYSFEVFAHTGIATVKEIRYQVLSDEVKVPTERLVAGLPDDLNVTISGTIDAKEDTEIRLVVEDWDHNEVSNGFTFYVQYSDVRRLPPGEVSGRPNA